MKLFTVIMLLSGVAFAQTPAPAAKPVHVAPAAPSHKAHGKKHRGKKSVAKPAVVAPAPASAPAKK